jgi:hypothetical protein
MYMYVYIYSSDALFHTHQQDGSVLFSSSIFFDHAAYAFVYVLRILRLFVSYLFFFNFLKEKVH